MTDTLRQPQPARLVGRRLGPASVRARAALVAVAAGFGVAGLAYVGTHDPHDASVPMPVCPFHLVTGLDCPGCGGLRMTHDLLTGQLGRAFADNAVLLVLTPVLLVLLGRAAWRWTRHPDVAPRNRPRPPTGRFEVSGPLGHALVAIAVTWTIVRNLAGW